ncbi:50S ribosomal protein L14 [Candidatus Berkelbacteria bacterium CG_4_8_14_3_um_filter_33_6]|uniref:Large ribosomal subunit protein uL14 n=1 Tax=Candidatus Berkelbacteria bacterium CG_4_10_14_0_2_um_filter_35_9_33_12 TaxID=1974499 RepID=A0A2M7W4M5_9BACT|nr:MAG: 50S ribosomal protein L14 [Candidatus Berkelbacteria bacterium CG23_combo_of_CG06-09_8_20_14_all_33_15]PIS08124.1 MAG: 50S ribosomal protein L14 [Candidatus Berkelbacteria bacterium CG10_big_fil_rev_8_21_14_0_10_33_10]PIX31284.1 MAG: 50S ribosomal protein L14 [Candidatus Berkelbacteria bacterium CG_4_8_14_3_um_filter_33_6]PIZ28438.1 MAG: 50S ribosomal protein L14 [Candidatus Berkelbacteria bacterium CG_4_10_14_0_8_um_filter_35_9_33_8]PJA20759.1 MAG: 50S ribosomal protein L14 [Candidatus
MIIQYTKLNVADNSGAKSIQVIQVYGKKRVAYVGSKVIATVKSAIVNGTVKKKEKVQAIIVRQKFPIKRKDGTVVKFSDNAAVIIKDKLPVGTRIIGPIALEIKEKGYQKIVSLAGELI